MKKQIPQKDLLSASTTIFKMIRNRLLSSSSKKSILDLFKNSSKPFGMTEDRPQDPPTYGDHYRALQKDLQRKGATGVHSHSHDDHSHSDHGHSHSGGNHGHSHSDHEHGHSHSDSNHGQSQRASENSGSKGKQANVNQLSAKASLEEDDDDFVEMWNPNAPAGPEHGGPRGAEPTRYNNEWEKNGRVSDFTN